MKRCVTHFDSKKSAHQMNPIFAYNPFPAPQPGNNFIPMSFRKSIKRCSFILISNNPITKDLCVTNKRV